MNMDVQTFRGTALRELTNEKGVYALCDLDCAPIYVGQSTDGIRTRVRRHLTSARSDVIANRHLDVWEIAEVWAWTVSLRDNSLEAKKMQENDINLLEKQVINHFNQQKPLVNGKLPDLSEMNESIPRKPDQVISILDNDIQTSRKDPINRMPRQASQLRDLIDYTIQVKNNAEQRRVLRVHYTRLREFYENFMKDSGETDY